MSHWFLLALISPLLWGTVSHIDKYLLSKYLKRRGIGALVLFSSLFSLIILPILYFLADDILSVRPVHIAGLLLIGVLSLIAVSATLYALEQNEASIVAPFSQLIPVFGYIFGFLMLGEVLTRNQLLASLIILLGVAILSVEFDEGKSIRFKRQLVLLMITSSVIFAFYETLFKDIALNYSFWNVVFWQYVGLSVSGVLIYVFHREFREDFLFLIHDNKKRVVGLNLLSELLVILGNVVFNFASLLAPIALVLLVDSYQPVFVFLIGTILTVFFPHISTEKLSFNHAAQKILAILVICIGSYLLYVKELPF